MWIKAQYNPPQCCYDTSWCYFVIIMFIIPNLVSHTDNISMYWWFIQILFPGERQNLLRSSCFYFFLGYEWITYALVIIQYLAKHALQYHEAFMIHVYPGCRKKTFTFFIYFSLFFGNGYTMGIRFDKASNNKFTLCVLERTTHYFSIQSIIHTHTHYTFTQKSTQYLSHITTQIQLKHQSTKMEQ